MHIPFNLPHLTGKEAHYMYKAVFNGKLSGNGEFTKRCQHFFEEKYGFKKCLLTTSCTDALEVKVVFLTYLFSEKPLATSSSIEYVERIDVRQ